MRGWLLDFGAIIACVRVLRTHALTRTRAHTHTLVWTQAQLKLPVTSNERICLALHAYAIKSTIPIFVSHNPNPQPNPESSLSALYMRSTHHDPAVSLPSRVLPELTRWTLCSA